MVKCTSLENWRPKGLVGSNPTPSASKILRESMATTALEITAFEPTRFSKKSATWVRAERQLDIRVSGLSGFRETTEDRRRRPQVNPTPDCLRLPPHSRMLSAV